MAVINFLIFGLPIVMCLFVGFFAQHWNGRTGILWFFLTAAVHGVLVIGLWHFMFNRWSNSVDEANLASVSIIAAIITVILMLIIIASLPNVDVQKRSIAAKLEASYEEPDMEQRRLELKAREIEIREKEVAHREREMELALREREMETSHRVRETKTSYREHETGNRKPTDLKKERGLPPLHRR